jgi:hypothetical protein
LLLAVKRGIKLERKATETCRIQNYVITVMLIWDVLSWIRIFSIPDTRIPDLGPGSLIPDLRFGYPIPDPKRGKK